MRRGGAIAGGRRVAEVVTSRGVEAWLLWKMAMRSGTVVGGRWCARASLHHAADPRAGPEPVARRRRGGCAGVEPRRPDPVAGRAVLGDRGPRRRRLHAERRDRPG